MEDSYKVRSRYILQVSENLFTQMTELQGLRKTVGAAEKSGKRLRASSNTAISTQHHPPAD